MPWGLLLEALGKTVVLDMHEDLPRQIYGKQWIPRLLRGPVAHLVALFEAIALPFFDALVCATPAIAQHRAGKRTVVVQNFPVSLFWEDRSAAGDHATRPPLAAYVGLITQLRGIREIVVALALLPPCLGAKLELFGRFSPPHLEPEIRGLPGWEHVRYHGWQSQEQLSSTMAACRLGLVTFLPAPNHTESQPNKLFEYMAAGLPVVASDFPLWPHSRIRASVASWSILQIRARSRELLSGFLRHPQEAEAMGRRGTEAVRATDVQLGIETKTLRMLPTAVAPAGGPMAAEPLMNIVYLHQYFNTPAQPDGALLRVRSSSGCARPYG